MFPWLPVCVYTGSFPNSVPTRTIPLTATSRRLKIRCGRDSPLPLLLEDKRDISNLRVCVWIKSPPHLFIFCVWLLCPSSLGPPRIGGQEAEIVCWPICAILCLSGCPSSRTMFTLTCPRCSPGVTVFVTHQSFLSTHSTLTTREACRPFIRESPAYMHVTSNLRYYSSRRPQTRRGSRLFSHVAALLVFAVQTYRQVPS
ncbi:hypothetical protein EDD85DRAFT_245510, partial [Armillaria nabsnona]